MTNQHIHHDLIVQWAKDTTQVVEFFGKYDEKWHKAEQCNWLEDYQYRIRHKHQDLIDQKAARPELIVEIKDKDFSWRVTHSPAWHPAFEYRLVEPRHKHQDLIDQKAARPELIVECKLGPSWHVVTSPSVWYEYNEYRLVEPMTKKKVKMWQWVVQYKNDSPRLNAEFCKKDVVPLDRQDIEHGWKTIQRADWTEIEVDE